VNKPGLQITEHAELHGLNTLAVAARARYLIELDDPSGLADLLADPRFSGLPLLTVGEGSNILFTGDFDGLVLRLNHAQIELLDEQADHALIRAEAGASWDALVTWTLQQGWSGIENLALIPGRCGAAPIQNIGAYGVELSDVLSTVEVYDRVERACRELAAADCGLGYRDSMFKRQPKRFVVLAIQLRLQRAARLRTDYAGLREELAAMQIDQPGASDVAEAVRRLRRRKLPQPDVLPNAGSFFKNPIVDADLAQSLRARYPAMPQWPTADLHCKLSAGWMIEQLGFKGRRVGDAGIAPGHALVLVNHGNASGSALLALAREVQDAVYTRFGVRVEPEPQII